MAERASPDHPGFKDKWIFDLKFGLIPWIHKRKNPYREAALKRFSWVASFCNNKDVLDVPCGMGWGISRIKTAKSIVGMDVSSNAVEEANERYGHRIRFMIGTMEKLPFACETFDLISCLEGIEHVPVSIGSNFLKEAFRTLRPNGLLLLSSPYCRNKPHSGNPYHIYEYPPSEIKEAISRWFTIQSITERDVDDLRVLYIVAVKKSKWYDLTSVFLQEEQRPNRCLYPSVYGGIETLYGTCYSLLTKKYLHLPMDVSAEFKDFISRSQSEKTGLLIGPELQEFTPAADAKHDFEHLSLHSTITVLPLVQEIDLPLQPISDAHKYCDLNYLQNWLNKIDWSNAWLEGNNLLFVGQLLVYLRDVEQRPGADKALGLWFSWLDKEVDPDTSLWGTQGYCSAAEAVYGGYHQLLVYWHEGHPIKNPKGLVDTVLSLRHSDGGFNPRGNGGACEDVDCVDILVNCYKRWDYRRPEIRHALRRCLRHILATQNSDGGFPYNRNRPQCHMGIPATEAEPNVSCAFPTWFRIHTFALIAEVLPNEPVLKGIPFRFNTSLSMGWHVSPPGWVPISDAMTFAERRVAVTSMIRRETERLLWVVMKLKRYVARAKKA